MTNKIKSGSEKVTWLYNSYKPFRLYKGGNKEVLRKVGMVALPILGGVAVAGIAAVLVLIPGLNSLLYVAPGIIGGAALGSMILWQKDYDAYKKANRIIPKQTEQETEKILEKYKAQHTETPLVANEPPVPQNIKVIESQLVTTFPGLSSFVRPNENVTVKDLLSTLELLIEDGPPEQVEE